MGLQLLSKGLMKPHKLAGTLALLYICIAFHAAADNMLPSVFSEVAVSFEQTPSGLGQIQGKRYVVSALSSILAAYLVMHMSRPRLIALGTILSAVTLAGVGLSLSLDLLVWCWVINSISLALVMPAISSFIGDAIPEKERGLAFGALSIFWGLGKSAGGFFATTMAGGTFYNYPGWRSAACAFALQGCLVGFCVYLFAVDATAESEEESLYDPLIDSPEGVPQSKLAKLKNEVTAVLKVDSFRAIIIQGVFGSWPWTALVFLTMWLELVGFSHSQAAILVACFNISVSISGFFGGWIGDFAAARMPDAGRVLCAQFSAFMLLPVFTGILLGLPNDPDYFVSYAVALFVGGLFIAWAGASTNNPIFSEVVPPHLRTTVYAVDRLLELLLASFGPLGVGYVAEHVFRFDLHDLGGHRNPKDADSLGMALAWNIGLPCTLCAICYTWLYRTYPRDRDSALKARGVIVVREPELLA